MNGYTSECLYTDTSLLSLLYFCLQINGEDVRAVPHKRAVDLFVGAGETVKLFVQHNAEALLRVSLYTGP